MVLGHVCELQTAEEAGRDEAEHAAGSARLPLLSTQVTSRVCTPPPHDAEQGLNAPLRQE